MTFKDQIKNWWFGAIQPAPLKDLAKSGNGAKDIGSYIAPIQFTRTTNDVQTWRAAIEEMERQILPFRTQVQRIYADTYLNGQTYAAIKKWKNLTLLKEYGLFKEDGTEDVEATKLIEGKWASLINDYVLDANFFGYTLIGLGDFDGIGFPNLKLIKRENISPDRLCVMPIVGSPQGWVYFTDPESKDEAGNAFIDWTIWVETPSETGQSRCGYGLLYKLALYEIFLKNNLADNATNNELFTQPYRQFKTDKTQADEVNELEKQAQNMGARAYAITGHNDEIIFHDTSSGGNGYKTYESLEDRLQSMISKIGFGNADVMDSKSGKLGNQQGEDNPVQKALEDAEAIGSKFLATEWNTQIIPKLRKIGVKIPEGLTFKFKNSHELEEIQERKNETNAKVATWVKAFSDAGYEVDPLQIEEMTGIKLVKKTVQEPKGLTPAIKNKLDDIYGGL